jgi:hypothetical protein
VLSAQEWVTTMFAARIQVEGQANLDDLDSDP